MFLILRRGEAQRRLINCTTRPIKLLQSEERLFTAPTHLTKNWTTQAEWICLLWAYKCHLMFTASLGGLITHGWPQCWSWLPTQCHFPKQHAHIPLLLSRCLHSTRSPRHMSLVQILSVVPRSRLTGQKMSVIESLHPGTGSTPKSRILEQISTEELLLPKTCKPPSH